MAVSPRKHYAPGDSPADRARRLTERRAEYDRGRTADPKWQFYRSDEWRRIRKAMLARQPRCQHCGSTSGPLHVDHIVGVRKAWARRLDPTNLQVLCHSCHSRKTVHETQSYRNGF
jgi:5-methylcytosine-specific restriction protein A